MPTPTGAGGDSDDGDDDNEPAFFAALTTPSTTMPLLPRPRKERRVTVVQIGGPRDSLDDDAFIVPP